MASRHSEKGCFFIAALALSGVKRQDQRREVWLTKIKRNGRFQA
nr:MAG TPA: hypothetical protein [Caudoviricetes sp.]